MISSLGYSRLLLWVPLVASFSSTSSSTSSRSVSSSSSCLITPSHLTVDYLPSLINTSAIESFLPRITDNPNPLLGWFVDSLLQQGIQAPSVAVVSQSAYRIVVATSLNLLPNNPDIFDSGMVSSSSNVAVPYTGPLLAARSRVFWTVAIWDGQGTACGFSSEISSWEVALVAPAAAAVDGRMRGVTTTTSNSTALSLSSLSSSLSSSSSSSLSTPVVADNDPWFGAKWITQLQQPHPPPSDCDLYADNASALFRTQFVLQAPASQILRARLYVAGLGYFIPYLNGQQVGDEVLAPGWTDFNTTVLYSTFDVTFALQQQQQHTLGIAVGNGWYNLIPLLFWGSRSFRNALPHGDPMTKVVLAIDYTGGVATQIIVSSPAAAGNWSTGNSEILFNSIFLGNRVDRRLEPVGWSTNSFTPSSSWVPPYEAIVGEATIGILRSQRVPPVRKQVPAITPVVLSSPPSSGEIVLDLGHQVAGICTFCFAASTQTNTSGGTINFRYGELLYPNGSVNGMTSVAGQVKNGNGGECAPQIAFQEDHYTLRGDSEGECFTPQFTWHSGRYIMVTANGDAASNAALNVLLPRAGGNTTCYALRSDVARSSSFSSSNSLLNAIHEASVLTAECNMMSIQSDCPARERQGYGGDALMSGESLISNFDMALFYEKRVDDYVAAQRGNGGFTETAPFVGISDAGLGDESGPIGWQTYMPVAAMWLYKYYGNSQVLTRSYAAATAYVEFLQTVSTSSIENGLGDWMALERKALPLTGLGFQMISYLEYANMSLALGNITQANKYSQLASSIAQQINTAFLDESTGVYAQAGVFNGTQCGQSMPLFLQIVPEASRNATVQVLVNNLLSPSNQGHLAVGAFGVKYLLMSLVDNGYADLAYGIMNNTEYPGFGYMLNGTANGLTNATTIWESWFTSDNTYSHNHAMFTSNEVYSYQGLAGIQPHPSAVGYDSVILKPSPPQAGGGGGGGRDGTLVSVNVTLFTHRGYITSSWQVFPSNGTFQLTVCIPPNIKAEVWLPIQGGGRRIIAPFAACCGCTLESQLW